MAPIIATSGIAFKKLKNGNVKVIDQATGKNIVSITPGQVVITDINNSNNIIIKSTTNTLENGLTFNVKDILINQCDPVITATDRTGIIDELSENFFFEISEGNKVLYFNSFYSFPPIGSEDIIYIDKKERQMYYWDGSFYVDYCLDSTRIIKIIYPRKTSDNNIFSNLIFPNTNINSLVEMEFQSSTSGTSVTKTFQIINNYGNLTGTTSTVDKVKGSGFDYAVGEIFFQIYPILSIEHKTSPSSTLTIKIRRLSGNLNLKQINISPTYESSIVIPENRETSKFLPANTGNILNHKLLITDNITKEIKESPVFLTSITKQKKIVIPSNNNWLIGGNNIDLIDTASTRQIDFDLPVYNGANSFSTNFNEYLIGNELYLTSALFCLKDIRVSSNKAVKVAFFRARKSSGSSAFSHFWRITNDINLIDNGIQNAFIDQNNGFASVFGGNEFLILGVKNIDNTAKTAFINITINGVVF